MQSRTLLTSPMLRSMLLLLLLSGGCSATPDDLLTVTKTPYSGDRPRIDGYYFMEYENIDRYLQVYFLYRDGVILYGDAFKLADLEEKKKEWQTDQWQSSLRAYKHRWGAFRTNGDLIEFDRWYPPSGGLQFSSPYYAYVNQGTILNDTTFVITDIFRLVEDQRTEEQTMQDTFHFSRFEPKPDSTNPYVR